MVDKSGSKESASLSPRFKNHLLASLSQEDYEWLLPELEKVPLSFKQVLYEQNEPLNYVYFPESGLASITGVVEDHKAVEVASVGKEGLVGLPLVLASERTSTRGIVQIAGEGWRLPGSSFRSNSYQGSRFQSLLMRYASILFDQAAQSTVCNQTHSIEERCSRWLLLAQDRMGKDNFPLTQEFLAIMLGVRRATVTVAAGALQKAGLIEYSRGYIKILDRARLEEFSCMCYEVIRKQSERLI